LLRKGFTVDQVVHDYGDLCQAITELNERLGSLAHELRNLLSTAMLAVQVIKSGDVGITGATGAVLERSLTGLRNLIDRSLAEVRMTVGIQVLREPISIHELFDELRISSGMEATAKRIAFTVMPVDKELVVDVDRQMITSAVANLLQNALKFTRLGGHVALTAHAVAERVVLEIEDECGGLLHGKTEEIFQPFEQRRPDRSGVGLGLSISRRAVEANGGTLRARDLPGKGCIFTIDLPRSGSAK